VVRHSAEAPRKGFFSGYLIPHHGLLRPLAPDTI
jgi:hypothetical protein